MQPAQNHHASPLEQPQCAVISISDVRSQDADRPGALIQQRLEKAGLQIARSGVIKDEPDTISKVLSALAKEQQIDAVVFNGSANLQEGKHAFDVISEMLNPRLPGFGELFRRFAYEEVGAGAMMLRGEAGLYRDLLVFAVPGSVKAVKLAMDRLIAPQIKDLLTRIHHSASS